MSHHEVENLMPVRSFLSNLKELCFDLINQAKNSPAVSADVQVYCLNEPEKNPLYEIGISDGATLVKIKNWAASVDLRTANGSTRDMIISLLKTDRIVLMADEDGQSPHGESTEYDLEKEQKIELFKSGNLNTEGNA